MKIWHALLVIAYSLVMSALVPLLRLEGCFSRTLAKQLAKRRPVAALANEIVCRRSAARTGILYFCSSAGEFEQAKPLIERFNATGDIYQHVVFFSQSGADYANARGEKTPYSLSPIDSCFAWGWLLAAMRPHLVVVVRHELWPAFLHTARNYAPVILIDAVVKSEEKRWSSWRRWLRRQLYSPFAKIYTVSEHDRNELKRLYGITDERLQVTGDTKYDRVLERMRALQRDTQKHIAVLNRAGSAVYRLILGSAHRPDVEVILKGRTRLERAMVEQWQLIIAPHDIGTEMLSWIEDRCIREGLSIKRYSQLAEPLETTQDVILIDVMGKLAEIYGAANAAFVGGAMHHQVHNVLEPAAHGLAVAFGPFYKNSQEAVQLVSHGLAGVCIDPEAVAGWWQGIRPESFQTDKERMLDLVATLTGAADHIHAELVQLMAQGSKD